MPVETCRRVYFQGRLGFFVSTIVSCHCRPSPGLPQDLYAATKAPQDAGEGLAPAASLAHSEGSNR